MNEVAVVGCHYLSVVLLFLEYLLEYSYDDNVGWINGRSYKSISFE